MKSLILLGLAMVILPLPLGARSPDKADKEEQMEALRELNDFIGEWKGGGEPEKAKPAASELWSETLSWAWRFKGDDVWLTLQIKNGKYYKSGDLRYDADKKVYTLELEDLKGKKAGFKGELKDGILTFQKEDPKSKETQRITMNTAADGVRFLYYVSHKPANRTIFVKDFKVAGTKDGESLAAAKKKNVCVVSGGLGTIPVSFGGETFYVCCSGCKDAFNENPEKFVKEFKAKQGKK